MRRFNTMQEITADPRYGLQNAVQQDNYRKLDGWYEFDEGCEVECCVSKKNGNLCKTCHRKGWVVELIDGTTSVIGGVCATKKFGANSIVGRDISLATNAIDLQAKLQRLKELLLERDQGLQELATMKVQLADAKRQLAEIHSRIGHAVWGRLARMSKTNSNAVTVEGVVPEVYNEEGDVIRDRKSVQIVVARLTNLDVCNDSKLATTLDGIRRIETAFREAPSEPNPDMKFREVKALNVALADRPRVINAAKEFIDQLAMFERNDFSSLIFLVTDPGERTRLMKYSLERRGEPSSKSIASERIQQWMAALKHQNEVTTLKVA